MTTSQQKIALVTGGNKGIGKEISRQLASQGLTVFLASRDLERGEEAASELRATSGDVRAVQLDVTDEASIARLKAQIEADFGRLDVLVNNAGVALESVGPAQASIEVLRATFDTNFFGAFAVIRGLLPLVLQSSAGRIVNVSSELGSLTCHSDPTWKYDAVNPFAYVASKTALNALTVSLAKELRGTHVKVNSVNPGYTATDLNNFQGPLTVEEGAHEPVRLALLEDDGPTGGFFEEGGQVAW
jgi:NAD(P)-dependent dehydrogenase (short-subunit alcohol dehydrogenase family)